VGAKRDPWQGQSHVFSVGFHLKVKNMCVQREEREKTET